MLAVSQKNERRTLNYLIKNYLGTAGYKLTAVTFAEEVTDQVRGVVAVPWLQRPLYVSRSSTTASFCLKCRQDLDDVASVGLHVRGTTLVNIHRDRIAPVSAALSSVALSQ